MISAIIFDWDGTILDSYQAIFTSYRYAYRHYLGIDFPRDAAEFRQLISKDSATTTGYASYKTTPLAGIYDSYYLSEGFRLVSIYQGLLPMIEMLHAQGLLTAVVTNKSSLRVSRDLHFLGLADLFDIVVTGDDVAASKPAPEPLFQAARRLQLEPCQCMYVGDAPEDIIAAHAAGMVSVASLWGFYSEAELQRYRPDYVIDQPEALQQLLAASDTRTHTASSASNAGGYDDLEKPEQTSKSRANHPPYSTTGCSHDRCL